LGVTFREMAGFRSAVSCFDRLFDKASSNKYYLSIRFQPDGLVYTIFDPELRKYIGFESAVLAGASEIYTYIKKNDVLNCKFEKSIVIIPSTHFTLVPEVLFIEQEKRKLFNFVHEEKAGDELASYSLKGLNATVVYSSGISWFEIVNDLLHPPLIIPSVGTILEFVIPRYRNSAGMKVFIDLHSSDFDLLILDEGKLIYCNNFSWFAPEDLTYYTIFVIDQLKINPEKVSTFISGNISSDSNMLKLLRKYIKDVDLLIFDQTLQLSYALNEVKTYNYPDLFNPRLCE